MEKESDIFPLFQFGVYYSDFSKAEMVRYDTDSFFIGLNNRAEILLQHIDSCITKHGRDVVIQ